MLRLIALLTSVSAGLAGWFAPAAAHAADVPVCSTIAGRAYVFEMSGASGTTGAPPNSAIIGRIAMSLNGKTGMAYSFANKWNGMSGFGSAPVVCTETGKRRGTLAFGSGRGSWKADFFFKTSFDALVLMRSDDKQAIVGEAIKAAPFPAGAIDACSAFQGVLAGVAEGWGPNEDVAELLQANAATGKATVLENSSAGSLQEIKSTVLCDNIASTGAGVMSIDYPSGGTRSIIFYVGGNFDTFPVINYTNRDPVSGWIYRQPAPKQYP